MLYVEGLLHHVLNVVYVECMLKYMYTYIMQVEICVYMCTGGRREEEEEDVVVGEHAETQRAEETLQRGVPKETGVKQEAVRGLQGARGRLCLLNLHINSMFY